MLTGAAEHRAATLRPAPIGPARTIRGGRAILSPSKGGASPPAPPFEAAAGGPHITSCRRRADAPAQPKEEKVRDIYSCFVPKSSPQFAQGRGLARIAESVPGTVGRLGRTASHGGVRLSPKDAVALERRTPSVQRAKTRAGQLHLKGGANSCALACAHTVRPPISTATPSAARPPMRASVAVAGTRWRRAGMRRTARRRARSGKERHRHGMVGPAGLEPATRPL